MSSRDVLAEAFRIGDEREAQAQARGRPLNYLPRGAGVGTNLDPAPKFTLTEARRLAKELCIPEPKHIGGNIFAVEAIVTPRMAHSWLKRRCDKFNRPPTDGQLASLARDARDGLFTVMDQGISFSKSGKLENGQHRCWGISIADEPIRAIIILNLPPRAREVIDQTVRRNARHLIDIFGDRMPTANQEAVIRRAMFGMEPSQRISIHHIIGFAAEHKRAFRWLFKHFNRTTRGITAPVQACVFRARISQPSQRKRLEQFADYLVASEFLHGGSYRRNRDRAVHTLRDWLMGTSVRRRNANASELYGITAYMLLSFFDRTDSQIRRLKEDPFDKPVPVIEKEGPFDVNELIDAAKKKLGMLAPTDDEDE